MEDRACVVGRMDVVMERWESETPLCDQEVFISHASPQEVRRASGVLYIRTVFCINLNTCRVISRDLRLKNTTVVKGT